MIRIDNPSSLPADLYRRLLHTTDLFRQCTTMNEARHDPDVLALAKEVEGVVTSDSVVAYHCTKELEPGQFASRGLRVLELDSHIAEFLAVIRDRAKPDLVAKFVHAYREWPSSEQRTMRDRMLHFVYTLAALRECSVWRFLTYYGGEALYCPFDDRQPCECLLYLETLGKPVVVEFKIPGDHITNGSCTANAMLSTYAKKINPSFEVICEVDNIQHDVPATNILAVHAAADVLPRSALTGYPDAV